MARRVFLPLSGGPSTYNESVAETGSAGGGSGGRRTLGDLWHLEKLERLHRKLEPAEDALETAAEEQTETAVKAAVKAVEPLVKAGLVDSLIPRRVKQVDQRTLDALAEMKRQVERLEAEWLQAEDDDEVFLLLN